MVYQVSASQDAQAERMSQSARSRHSSGTDRLSINGGHQTSPFGGNLPNGSVHHNYQDADQNSIVTMNGGGGMGTPMQQPRLEFPTAEEKDAFLIFRALCKLSIKQLPDDQDPRFLL